MCLQCRRPRFDSWVGKILWRRKWQPTPVFSPGESCGQRSLGRLLSTGLQESDMTYWLKHHHHDELQKHFCQETLKCLRVSPNSHGNDQTSLCACILSCFSHIWLFATLWTIAYQAFLSMGFSRQEYWNGSPLLFPGDLLNPGIKPKSPALQSDSLPSEPPGKPIGEVKSSLYKRIKRKDKG